MISIKTSDFSLGESNALSEFMRTSDACEQMRLKKNEFVVQQGAVCEHFCLVESGILQHSILVSDEEKTTYLALRNSLTTALASFLDRTPSRKSIKAISDCNLIVIERKSFQILIDTDRTFRELYFGLIERQLCLIDEYRIDLLTLTPEERYSKLLETEPDLIKEVPLHYLASFLGISTRHMSRIRKSAIS